MRLRVDTMNYLYISFRDILQRNKMKLASIEFHWFPKKFIEFHWPSLKKFVYHWLLNYDERKDNLYYILWASTLCFYLHVNNLFCVFLLNTMLSITQYDSYSLMFAFETNVLLNVSSILLLTNMENYP